MSLPVLSICLAAALAAPDSVDLRARRASLLAADQAYSAASARTTLVEGIVAMLAPETAVMVAGHPFLRTPQEARAALSANPAAAGAVQTWTPVRVDVSGDGRDGYTYGYMQQRLEDGTTRPGKYTAYWRMQPDGTWKVLAYKRVGSPAAPASHDPPPGFASPDVARYPAVPGASAATARQEAMEADLAFARLGQSGISAAFQAYAAEDGANHAGDPEIRFGREAIGRIGDDGSFNWWPVIADAAASGDLAFTMGQVEVYETQADGTRRVAGTGQYLTVWRRQPDGRWLYVID